MADPAPKRIVDTPQPLVNAVEQTLAEFGYHVSGECSQHVAYAAWMASDAASPASEARPDDLEPIRERWESLLVREAQGERTCSSETAIHDIGFLLAVTDALAKEVETLRGRLPEARAEPTPGYWAQVGEPSEEAIHAAIAEHWHMWEKLGQQISVQQVDRVVVAELRAAYAVDFGRAPAPGEGQ